MKHVLFSRRRFLVGVVSLPFGLHAGPGLGGAIAYPQVRPGVPLVFPRDHGAHPTFRTEWWYVTGSLRLPGGEEVGFQVTFFRNRPPGAASDNPSRFAPDQILFAHAGVSDPKAGRIETAERAARDGFGLARAEEGDADVAIDDWFFRRRSDGRFETRVGDNAFEVELLLEPTTPPLLQGENGYSRKGPAPENASYYYSLPQLRVSGTLRTQECGDEALPVTGLAWLDREWSSDLLASGIVGWDWTGLNFADGSALTAFRLRDAAGASAYAGGSWRGADGSVETLPPDAVAFHPRQMWRSERSGGTYPVDPVVEVRLGSGALTLPLTAAMVDQEVGSALGLPVYWEGLVRGPDCVGYLELVGYGSAVRF
ncbi:lipocalin-like domain-containing protein [Aureimonas sp. AU4]|uniref:lipocalin-like domain-containing protein n=1 Tax=Aureimonas sp. AU4 TaxID=1638163 RepID=UPI000705DFDE|nr:lipocalin-like domain-containing protein [Aureimonas sp. AU4]BAT30356.1 hypothetical protein [Aureimonas sp. AU4]